MTDRNKDVEEARKNIEETREKYENARLNLVEQYLSTIRREYQELRPEEKEILVGRLDEIVNCIQEDNLTDLTANSIRKNLNFNGRKAKKVREECGISQSQLAQDLELGKPGQIAISRYEGGKEKPSNPPRGKTSTSYMGWLKEKGYNPFEL